MDNAPQSSSGARAPRPRPIRIEGDVAYVPLTKGYTAIIDAADVPLVEKWAWHAIVAKNGAVYAQRSAQENGRRYHMSMHRVIAGALPDEDVDHWDGDGLNNRGANLRRGTTTQNMGNMRLLARNRLGVKGVCASGEKFVAYISVANRSRHLGTFATVAEAKAAYDAAAAELFGEFARSA